MTDEPFANQISFAQKYGPAMAIQNQDDADAYFERCVEHMMRAGGYSRQEAERIERINVAQFAGYFDKEIRTRIGALFKTEVP